MKYIELDVRTAIIAHGYDSENKLIEEKIGDKEFVRKIVALKRIRSISEKYILVSSQDGREMYWEYKGGLEDVKEKLIKLGVPVA